MVIQISDITSINPNIFEMAEIDGANAWQRALYIAMPLLKPTFVVMLTLCISGNMKTFDHVYVMTGGGPGNATSVMALYAYNISFIRNNMGYGSALSIGLLVLSLSVIMGTRWGINRLFAGKEAYMKTALSGAFRNLSFPLSSTSCWVSSRFPASSRLSG